MSVQPALPAWRVLLGATASGKECLAVDLAERLGGEIVSVDSMKIYRGLEIGAAQPPAEYRARAPHHLVGFLDPSELFSAARYAEEAEKVIADIEGRGKLPILSGGTALYYKALLEGFFNGPPADEDLRNRLLQEAEEKGSAVLHARLKELDPASAERIHVNDMLRLVRALEVVEKTGAPISRLQTQFGALRPDKRIAMVGLLWDREELHRRISERVDRMLAQGLVDEARGLYKRMPPVGRQARLAVGYAELFRHFAGEIDMDEAVALIKQNTRRLAKSQMTWFRKFDCYWIKMARGRGQEEIIEEIASAWHTRIG